MQKSLSSRELNIKFEKTASIQKVLTVSLIALVATIVNYKIATQGVIFETPDLHIHLKWLQHFYGHLAEGIAYPRWLTDLNYGYGSPTFVFYPPAAVYLGSALKALGLSTERAMATLLLGASFVAGCGMYLYCASYRRPAAALIGAIAYITAPYLIYNSYHRGAVAEVLATSLLPFFFWLTDRAMKCPQKWIALPLCFTLLSLTHLPSLLLVTIAWSVYVLASAWTSRCSFKRLIQLGVSPVLGFGIASFYLLPALTEKRLVNLDSMRGVAGGFAAHLIPLNGVGGNLSGHLVSMARYGIASIVGCLALTVILSGFKLARIRQSLVWLLCAGSLGLLMSSVSYSLWAISPTLQMVQFPWRLMGLLSLVYAGSIGLAADALLTTSFRNRRWYRLIAGTLLVVLLGWNLRYSAVLVSRYAGFYAPGDLTAARAEDRWESRSYDYVALALTAPDIHQKDVPEYLPLLPDAQQPVSPPLPRQPQVQLLTGSATVDLLRWQGYQRLIQVQAETQVQLQLRTYHYPVWQVYLNDQPHTTWVTPDGLIGVTLPPGEHRIEVSYRATRSMQLGVILSGLSVVTLGFLLARQQNLYVNRKSALPDD
ncbi:MAG: 6-pyruvoyl-tetrahydropterin synthase-related protein [Cyanobacteria bacterium J06554_6]